MIKIVTKEKMEDFVLRNSYQDFTGESNDGMRRGYSYTVHVTYTFSFENERHEDGGGWSYDFCVVKDTDDYVRNYDMTATSERFEENFDFITRALRNKGIFMLNFPAYMSVKAEFHTFVSRWDIDQGLVSTAPDEDAIELSFDGGLCPVREGIEVLTASELLARVGEEDAKGKRLMIARAIGIKTLLDRSYAVSLDSISDELFGKTKLIKLKKANIANLLSDVADLEQVLADFVDRAKEARSYYPISIEGGIEGFIVNFPDELRREVLRRCRQTSANLQLLRDYCPEGIEWRSVKAEDYLDSDLDLMIQEKEYAYTAVQWEFIEHCMEKPELEKKVVEHAYVIGHCDLSRIANNLHECTTTDLIRSIMKYDRENPGRVELRYISCLFGLEYEGLDRGDYDCLAMMADGCLVTTDSCKTAEMVAFMLKVGLLAGVSEAELVEMLLDKKASTCISLCNWCLKGVYEEFAFAPGLAWVKEEEDRREAARQRVAKERAESNEKVVRFVQESGKLAVRVSLEYSYCSSSADGRKVCRPDGEHIGNLQSDENRILLVEGRRYYYLVNVERVKKLRGGVFHFDVLEDDAGYIIGSKGSHIKEITQKLNKLGCEVRNIKIHTHTAEEV